MRGQIAGMAAAIALIAATTAQAKSVEAKPAQPCVTPAEIRGFVGYIMPGIVAGAVKKCGPAVLPGGYFDTRGSQLVERLSAGREASWPMASQAFHKMGGEFKGVTTGVLSDNTIRAMIENELTAKLVGSIPLSMCRDIEAIVAPLDPLPADNVVQFISAIFAVAGKGGSEFKACPAQ